MKTLNAKLFEKRKQENKLVAKFPGKKTQSIFADLVCTL